MEKKDEQNSVGLNRRQFIGALGAAATAGAILQTGGGSAEGAATKLYYEDSNLNTVPISPDVASKGGALYDEALNVPLYVSAVGQVTHYPRNFVCSSVDLLPLFYRLAIGNDGWRCNTSGDIVQYLSGRESIYDFMFHSGSAAQRRVAPTLLGAGNQMLPYVLHTTDEYSSATLPTTSPSHAIAFRTVDLTTNPSPGKYGGAKLGMYTYWPTANSCSATDGPTWPDDSQQSGRKRISSSSFTTMTLTLPIPPVIPASC